MEYIMCSYLWILHVEGRIQYFFINFHCIFGTMNTELRDSHKLDDGPAPRISSSQQSSFYEC